MPTAKKILGIRFDLVGYTTVLERICEWRTAGATEYISITNPHSVLLCHRNRRMMQATQNAAMTLPDGVGIILAANILRLANYGRVTGPALLLKLCDQGRQFGLRHYFYGSRPGVAKNLTDRLTQRYPGLKIAGTYSPPFGETTNEQDEQIIAQINRTQPDILWVGLGAPRQEIWMADHHRRITAAAMIGVGAAFDFHSGQVKWAPAWIRSIGLEWAYRLLHEPKRLWRRNLDSPRFLFKVLAQRFTTPFRQPAIEEHELILKD